MLHPMKKTLKRILAPLTLSLAVASASGCASMGVKEPSDAEINEQAIKAYEEVKAKSKISTHK